MLVVEEEEVEVVRVVVVDAKLSMTTKIVGCTVCRLVCLNLIDGSNAQSIGRARTSAPSSDHDHVIA